jgi:Ca2+/Na+ antiporter
LLFLPLKINFNIFSTVLFFVLGVTLFTWYFLETGRRLNRKEGIILLFSYIFFLMTTFGVQITLI